jgi:hypothetical protein
LLLAAAVLLSTLSSHSFSVKFVVNYGHLRKRHRERKLCSKKLAIAWRRRRRKRLNERRPSYFSSFSSLPPLDES